MPGSLETKAGSIRYHIKALIDIPYASKFLFINIFQLPYGFDLFNEVIYVIQLKTLNS